MRSCPQVCHMPAQGVHLQPQQKRRCVPDSLLENLRSDHSRNYGWSLACCAWQRDLAEDVLQEAYLRVLDGRAVFSGQSSHRTWFFAVIKRIAGEIHRTQTRRSILNLQLVPDEEGDAASAPLASEGPVAVQQSQAEAALQAALLQLSQRQREVLHLVFYSELTLEEAAQTLQISLGSVRTHYHRGKSQLARLLQLDYDDE